MARLKIETGVLSSYRVIAAAFLLIGLIASISLRRSMNPMEAVPETTYCTGCNSLESMKGLTVLFPEDIRQRKSEQMACRGFDKDSQPPWLSNLCRAFKLLNTHYTVAQRWTVTVLFPQEFRELRESQGFASDFAFAQSLRTAEPRGMISSRSGAKFYKTVDGRVILKEVSVTDIHSFMQIAPAYFEHVEGRSSLARILGAYQMVFAETGDRLNIIAMEATDPTDDMKKSKRYDLKGLLQYFVPDSDAFFEGPLFLSPESRRKLFCTVKKDTAFLQNQGLTDYSLLVFHTEDGIVLVSLIDYLSTYTWLTVYRHLKVSVRIFGRGWLDYFGRWLGTISEEKIKCHMKEDCVIHPSSYRSRLLKAMDSYFP